MDSRRANKYAIFTEAWIRQHKLQSTHQQKDLSWQFRLRMPYLSWKRWMQIAIKVQRKGGTCTIFHTQTITVTSPPKFISCTKRMLRTVKHLSVASKTSSVINNRHKHKLTKLTSSIKSPMVARLSRAIIGKSGIQSKQPELSKSFIWKS